MLKAPRFCRGAFRLRRENYLSTAEGKKDVGISTKFAEYYFLLLPKLEDPSQIFLDILNAVIAGNSGL